MQFKQLSRTTLSVNSKTSYFIFIHVFINSYFIPLPELRRIRGSQTDASAFAAAVVVDAAAPAVVVVDVVAVAAAVVVESRLAEVVAVAATVVFAVQFVAVEVVTGVHIHDNTAGTLRPVQLRNFPRLQKLQRKT